MFYLFVLLIVIGYLIYSGLRKLHMKSLKISCPCTFVATTLLALVLQATDHKILSWIVFFIGLYLLSLTLLAIRKVSVQKLETASGALRQ